MTPRYRFYTLLAVIFSLIIWGIWVAFSPAYPMERTLATNTQLFHGVRLSITPHLSSDTIRIRLDMESFEHPEFLDLDMTDVTFILLNDEDAIQPLRWDVDQRKNGRVLGDIWFEHPLPASIEKLTFMFYEYEHEHTFYWIL